MTDRTPRKRKQNPLFALGLLLIGAGLGLLAMDSPADPPATQPAKAKPIVAKDTTFIIGPLKSDGTVDYVAYLNETYSKGVTLENNATLRLFQAFGPEQTTPEIRDEFWRRLGTAPPPATGDYLVAWDKFATAELAATTTRPVEPSPSTTSPATDYEYKLQIVDRLKVATSTLWSAQDDPLLARWLNAQQKPLALIADASRRPRYYMPLVSSKSSKPEFAMMNVLLPGLGAYRESARALVARAMLRANSGDVAGGSADLMTAARLGGLMEQDPTLIGHMVGLACLNLASQGIRNLAISGKLTVPQTRELAGDLAGLPPISDCSEVIDKEERLVLLDVAVQCSAGSGLDFGELCLKASFEEVDWNDVLRAVNQFWNDQVQAFRQPTFAGRKAAAMRMNEEIKKRKLRVGSPFRDDPDSKAITILHGSQDVADYLIAGCMPSFSSVNESIERARVDRSLTILTLALAAFKAETGKCPDKLAELAPGFLKAIPLDTFIDGPLHYSRTADGYLIYSVGPNMKDDGGEKDDAAGKDDIAVQVPPTPKTGK